MNTTGRMIFALVIAADLAAIATVGAVNLHRRAVQETRVIELAKIVVTPAKATAEPIELAAIVVTPSDADWRYAEAHGVSRPAMTSVALATVVVQPTAEQVATMQLAGVVPATTAGAAEDAAAASLMQALTALSPGQFLDTGAALRAFNVLVFDGLGR